MASSLTTASDTQLRAWRLDILAAAYRSQRPAVTRQCAQQVEALNAEIRRRSAGHFARPRVRGI
jgi:hypothetical protein